MSIRYKRPDNKNALSILEASKREIKFALKLELSEESSATIIRNIYEAFRMIGDAIMVSKGIKSEDHLAPIKELVKVKVNTPRPLGALDNFRMLRHNVNYYGYKPSIEEAKDITDFAKKCFELVYEEVLKMISS